MRVSLVRKVRNSGKGTSLLETRATISAAEASEPVGGRCPSIAAPVAHITFYVEVLERYMVGGGVGTVDWEDIWRRVREDTPDEWEGSKAHLEQA